MFVCNITIVLDYNEVYGIKSICRGDLRSVTYGVMSHALLIYFETVANIQNIIGVDVRVGFGAFRELNMKTCVKLVMCNTNTIVIVIFYFIIISYCDYIVYMHGFDSSKTLNDQKCVT